MKIVELGTVSRETKADVFGLPADGFQAINPATGQLEDLRDV